MASWLFNVSSLRNEIKTMSKKVISKKHFALFSSMTGATNAKTNIAHAYQAKINPIAQKTCYATAVDIRASGKTYFGHIFPDKPGNNHLCPSRTKSRH